MESFWAGNTKVHQFYRCFNSVDAVAKPSLPREAGLCAIPDGAHPLSALHRSLPDFSHVIVTGNSITCRVAEGIMKLETLLRDSTINGGHDSA